jgi:hypothetical protein
MENQEQTKALQQAIQNFKDFIKGADHSQPATLNLIIGDELSENEIEYIETLVQDFESFEVFRNEDEDLILTTDQLIIMKNDLENHLHYLDTEVERNAADEYQNDNELFGEDL